MNVNELKINGNTLEDFLQTSREVDEYDNLDCRICAADCIRQLVDFVSQQQTEIEALKKEKWLTEIDAKQQALKQVIDMLVLHHDTLACSSYPMSKENRK